MDEYRNHASLYDLLVGPFLHSTHRDIVDIVKVHGCSSLLDICCGTGLLVGKAVAAGLKPVGTDLSPAMLDIARSNHPGVDFFQHDASELPMEDGSFDAVTVSFALHEKPRDVALLLFEKLSDLSARVGLLLLLIIIFQSATAHFLQVLRFNAWSVSQVNSIMHILKSI